MKTVLRSTALISSLVGFVAGAAFDWLAAPRVAHAQLYAPPPSRPANRPAATEVDAQKFVLVDSSGKVQAEIKMEDDEPQIVLYDRKGRVGWVATPRSGGGIHPVEAN